VARADRPALTGGRGELLARLGRSAEARHEFELAASLCANAAAAARSRRRRATGEFRKQTVRHRRYLAVHASS
jgi:predicted RNA polymerase sigma factor